MSDFDVFGDYEPERPATLEEDRPEPPKKEKQPRERKPGGFYNFVSFLFLLATVGMVIYTVLLIQNPNAPYNLFPPDTPAPTPTLFVIGGEGGLPPTWTPPPPPTEEPSPTPGATPTRTATPPPTPTRLTPEPGATVTISFFPFTPQDDAVTYTRNTREEECAWASIAGQVFDQNGGPVIGLPVQVTGDNFEQIVFTGAEPFFGPSGYEVKINTTPVEDEFVVRLLGTTGQPYSEPVVVRTLSSCDRNIAVLNFVQNHPIDN